MDEKLTKKERRALAREEKQNARAKTALMSKVKTVFYWVAGIGVVVAVGAFLLGGEGGSGSDGLQNKFASYAEELGLDREAFLNDLGVSDLEAKVDSDIVSGNSAGANSTPTFYLNSVKVDNPGSFEDFKALVNGVLVDSSGANGVEILKNDWIKGGEEAKAILVEYGDFQCPACGAFHPIVKKLAEEFPEDLMVIYRHFPLVNIHRNAKAAAIASEAAGKQGKFWEMHDILFERQSDWSNIR